MGEIADFAARLDEQRRRVDTVVSSPDGEEVEREDPADIARRIPRLWALFGKAS